MLVLFIKTLQENDRHWQRRQGSPVSRYRRRNCAESLYTSPWSGRLTIPCTKSSHVTGRHKDDRDWLGQAKKELDNTRCSKLEGLYGAWDTSTI